jgi:hypothetical protein
MSWKVVGPSWDEVRKGRRVTIENPDVYHRGLVMSVKDNHLDGSRTAVWFKKGFNIYTDQVNLVKVEEWIPEYVPGRHYMATVRNAHSIEVVRLDGPTPEMGWTWASLGVVGGYVVHRDEDVRDARELRGSEVTGRR